MDPMIIIIWLVIGAIAGWLAGQIVKGGGFGLVGDIVVGIVGSVVAGWLLPRVGLYIGGGFIADDHQRRDRRGGPVARRTPRQALTRHSAWHLAGRGSTRAAAPLLSGAIQRPRDVD